MDDNINNLQSLLDRSIKEEYDVPKLLSDALKQKYAQQNPVMQERERRLADLYAAPEEAANAFSQPRTTNIGIPGQTPLSTVSDVYLNPSNQMALTARRTASQYAPVATLNDILSAQYGGIENIIGETRKLYESKTKRAESRLQTGIDLEKLRVQAGGAGETAEMRNRRAALNPASIAIKRLKSANLSGVGTVRAQTVKARINFPFGLGKAFIGEKDQDLVFLNQQFELLRQNVVRALQGARMSDIDIQLAQNYVPSIQDSPQTIKTNLENLEAFIESLGSQTTETDIRPPISSFEY